MIRAKMCLEASSAGGYAGLEEELRNRRACQTANNYMMEMALYEARALRRRAHILPKAGYVLTKRSCRMSCRLI